MPLAWQLWKNHWGQGEEEEEPRTCLGGESGLEVQMVRGAISLTMWVLGGIENEWPVGGLCRG